MFLKPLTRSHVKLITALYCLSSDSSQIYFIYIFLPEMMLKWNLQHQTGGANDQAAALGGRTGWLETTLMRALRVNQRIEVLGSSLWMTPFKLGRIHLILCSYKNIHQTSCNCFFASFIHSYLIYSNHSICTSHLKHDYLANISKRLWVWINGKCQHAILTQEI